ncbi:hypothetical protein COBT_002529, partial [Conglomerata obtusa]
MKNPKILIHLRYMYMMAFNLEKNESTKMLKHMYQITKKYQIRISQDVKRNICFKCYSVLIPTITCTSQIIKEKKLLFFKITCNCGAEKKFDL